MEDDDEFGDLYTDVLLPFASASSSTPQPPPPQSSATPPSSSRSIDLNLRTDHEDIRYGPSYPNSALPRQSSDQTTTPNHGGSVKESALAAASNYAPDMIGGGEKDERRVGKQEKSGEGGVVIERRGDAESADRALVDLNRGKESGIDGERSEVAAGGVDLTEKEVKFDIEEDGDGIEDVGSEPIIPGLSSDGGGYNNDDGGVLVTTAGAEASRRTDESGDKGEGDDWDSDSEDDLQIVLNDNNHLNMERSGMVGDDEDEDDEDSELVIVADGDPNQAAEAQDWGENTAQTADGERKDLGDSTKASGVVTVVPKVGYSNHGYHPFHSQFKVSVLCHVKGDDYLYLGFLVSRF